jgi:hypothetical protein
LWAWTTSGWKLRSTARSGRAAASVVIVERRRNGTSKWVTAGSSRSTHGPPADATATVSP